MKATKTHNGKRLWPEAIKIQTYGTSCKYCHVEKAFSFLCFFSLLGVAQENCTTISSYVQYSTPQQATGV